MVRIEMEDGGVITLELDHDAAPKTVDNFEKLVREGFYAGLFFLRVIRGFMIPGGDPTGTGMGGADENIVGEFALNGHPNPISHKRGVISMARAQDFNSASSQFFIVHEDAPYLDEQYAAFGHVVDGMDIVDEIANVPTGYMDRPRTDMRMKKVMLVED